MFQISVVASVDSNFTWTCDFSYTLYRIGPGVYSITLYVLETVSARCDNFVPSK